MTENHPSLLSPRARRIYGVSWKILILFFVWMRFHDLTIRPLHHDEGVNGNFMKNIMINIGWSYDPRNYHGPLLYYAQLIPTWAIQIQQEGLRNFKLKSTKGLSPFSLRIGVAVMGSIVVGITLLTAPLIGGAGAFCAFVLTGFSCDLAYYSRYFIHEIYVVLFTLTTFLGGVYFRKTHRPIYLYVGVLSAVLLFCTKETSLVILFILGLSWILTELTSWFLGEKNRSFPYRNFKNDVLTFVEKYKWHLLSLGLISTFIWAFLFTSHFTNKDGLLDSFRTYYYWTQEGVESGHNKPFLYFISDILVRYELPLVLLSFVGLVLAFIRNEKIGLFLSFWTLGIIGFHSLTPYKTPWLIINFIVPMALLSGYGFQSLINLILKQNDSRAFIKISLVSFFTLFIIGLQFPKTWTTLYKEADDEKHPQAYAHTNRSVFPLLDQIATIANQPGLDKKINIHVFTEKYWPLPFYLMSYPNVKFYGKHQGITRIDAPLILADAYKRQELDLLLKESYTIQNHSLRPGVPLLLYINNRYMVGKDGKPLQIPELLSDIKVNSPLKSGLKKEIFDQTDFSKAPIRIESGRADFDFSWNDDSQKGRPSPFAFRWSGLIKIETAGTYSFATESDDGSWIILDDVTIVDNGGDHAILRMSGNAKLSVGLHKIEIRYYDMGGGAVLKCLWTPPGQKESALPSNILFSTE